MGDRATTYRLHYTSEDYPQGGTWSVYVEEYEHRDAPEPIDGSQRLVALSLPDEATADACAGALQRALREATDAQRVNIEQLSEDQALSVVHRLRERFDWSGTEFMRSDVTEHVRDAWTESHPETALTPEREAELVDLIMGGYTYRKLADRFAELGNELLDDRAREVVNGDLEEL